MTTKRQPLTSAKFDLMDEAGLKEYYHAYFPAGSGPLSCMRIICELILSICAQRGIDTSDWTNF